MKVTNLKDYNTNKLRSLILGCTEKSKKEEVKEALSKMNREQLQQSYLILQKTIKQPIRLGRKLSIEEFYIFIEAIALMQTLVYKIDILEEFDVVFRADIKTQLQNNRNKCIEALNTYMNGADADFYDNVDKCVKNCETYLEKAKNNILFE